MSRYRKLIAAAVGLVAIVLGPSVLGLTPDETIFGIGQETVVEGAVAVLTALGVWGLRNDETA